MMHKLEKDFTEICRIIISENKTLQEWSEIESSNMFQIGAYSGRFDATEEEFTFSYYNQDNEEFWFQIPLSEIRKVLNGEILEIPAQPA